MDRHNGDRAAKELRKAPREKSVGCTARYASTVRGTAIGLECLGSPTPELVANRRALRGRAPLLLVSKHQPTLLQVIRRHFDGHAIAGKRFDAILPHLAGGIGDDLVPGVELDARFRVQLATA